MSIEQLENSDHSVVVDTVDTTIAMVFSVDALVLIRDDVLHSL